MKRFVLVITLALTACILSPAHGQTPLKLGVLAYRPKPLTIAQWQPVAAYLQSALKRPVELAVYDHAELAARAARRAVDVVITSPNHFILLQRSSALSAPLATLISREDPHNLSAYGGAIVARADRDDIGSLRDLAGRRIAAVSTDAFGGYLMQQLELLEAGIPLPSGDRLTLTGQPHERVIEAVISGRADAGFVRAGLVESLVRDNKLEARRIKIINRQDFPDFPFAASTRLYPEWPVAVLPHVDKDLAGRLAAALFLLPRNSLTGPAATISGFTIPANYDGVENLLRKLRLPPFDRPPEFTVADLWKRHASWIISLTGLLLLLSVASAGLIVLYRRSQHSLREVERLAEKERLLLANLAEGVYGVDTRERCIFVNPAALAMLGFNASELIEGKIHDLFHRHMESGLPNPTEECPVLRTLRDGARREAEVMFTRKDGSTFPVSLAVSAMRHGGGIVGAVVAFQDITERKRAEEAVFEAQQVFRTLVENSPDIVARYDRDCRRTYVNPTYLKVAQIPLGELQDFTPEQRSPLPRESAAILQQLLKRVLDSGVAEATDVVWPREGGIMSWYNIYAFPEVDREGRVVSVMTVSRDITRRKQVEEELIQRTHELDQEIAERQVAQENLQEQALLLENEMEERRAAQEELERTNERLEQRVSERTAELEAKNTDLQNMLKSFVGRELRMVELKERIKELEGIRSSSGAAETVKVD